MGKMKDEYIGIAVAMQKAEELMGKGYCFNVDYDTMTWFVEFLSPKEKRYTSFRIELYDKEDPGAHWCFTMEEAIERAYLNVLEGKDVPLREESKDD